MNKTFALILSIIFLNACSSSKKAVTLNALDVNAADDVYRATVTMDWDITHTDVSLDFNTLEKTANGKAVISMHPYFYSSDKIVLDAKCMQIHAVTLNMAKADYLYRNDSLIINLARLYHHTETVKLEVTYKAMPYTKTTTGGKAISDDKGLYFINTDNAIPGKPSQIWTQGETESNSFWVPTFDKPNERFTTSIQLTVPDSLTTLSNGMFLGSTPASNGMRIDKWEMDKDIQPYVMMFAIGKYAVVHDKPWRGKTVNYYVEHEYEPYALDMFRHTPEMMEFFSNVTGVPYPWNKYSQVVVRDYVSGAMENTSATVFGEFINQTTKEIKDKDYEDVVSHELFHQWFGDYVTAESWSHLTLNESFATYGEQLWRRYKYGTANAQKLGFEDMMIYLNQSKLNDEPLTRFHYKKRDDMFDRISYQKGASILHYLNGLTGDSAFYKAMNIYLTDNALKPAETHHWRLAIEKATGKDWNWFFNQWYFRGGHPELDIKYEFDDKAKKVKITFEQKQDKIYRLPIMVTVAGNNKSETILTDINKRVFSTTYNYTDNTQPAVFIDSEHWLPVVIHDNKTPEQWLTAYLRAADEDFISKARALMHNATKTENSTIQQLYSLALSDKLEYIKVYALGYLQSNKNTVTQNTLTTHILPLIKDTSNHVRAAAFEVLTAWEQKFVLKDMFPALNDESYKVAAAALNGINKFQKDTVYTIAKQMLDKKPGGELEYAVWETICEKGLAADTVLLKQWQYQVGGKNKLDLALALNSYMTNTPSDEAFKVALDIMEYITQTEAIAPYRSVMIDDMNEVATYFKEEVNSGIRKASVTKAANRVSLIYNAFNRLEKKETDENNLDNYKKYKNILSGKKA